MRIWHKFRKWNGDETRKREGYRNCSEKQLLQKFLEKALLCSSAFSTYEGLPPATETEDYQVPLKEFFAVFRAAIFEHHFDLTPKIL